MAKDFEKEITQIAGMITVPGYEVQPETIEIATEALEDIDSRYGHQSEKPLAYHNAPHSLDVPRRVVRLLNMFHPYIQPKYQDMVYDLGIVCGTTHDYEQDLKPGDNERASADYAIGKVEEKDGLLNTDLSKKRIFDGTMATAVERKEDGEIVQSNIQSGSHDPLKFAMAFADINGIAMEGDTRMIRDVTRLCFEIFEEPSIDQVYDFLINQAGFLRDRLNDGRVKSDIAYYFPDSIDEVYGEMRKSFRANILSSYNLALLLNERPELKTTIGVPIQNLGHLDRKILGDVIGKLLRKKLAHVS